MLKFLIIVCAALTLTWFFYLGFTGQPYVFPTFATLKLFFNRL